MKNSGGMATHFAPSVFGSAGSLADYLLRDASAADVQEAIKTFVLEVLLDGRFADPEADTEMVEYLGVYDCQDYRRKFVTHELAENDTSALVELVLIFVLITQIRDKGAGDGHQQAFRYPKSMLCIADRIVAQWKSQEEAGGRMVNNFLRLVLGDKEEEILRFAPMFERSFPLLGELALKSWANIYFDGWHDNARKEFRSKVLDNVTHHVRSNRWFDDKNGRDKGVHLEAINNILRGAQGSCEAVMKIMARERLVVGGLDLALSDLSVQDMMAARERHDNTLSESAICAYNAKMQEVEKLIASVDRFMFAMRAKLKTEQGLDIGEPSRIETVSYRILSPESSVLSIKLLPGTKWDDKFYGSVVRKVYVACDELKGLMFPGPHDPQRLSCQLVFQDRKISPEFVWWL